MNNDDMNLPLSTPELAEDKGNVPPDLSLDTPSYIPFAQQQAIQSIIACQRSSDKTLTADQMLSELHNAFTADGDGAHLLFTQVQVLDSLFARLLNKALTANGCSGNPVPDYVNDTRILLALQTQRQCRIAIETLAVLKSRKDYQEEKNYEQTEGL